MLDFMPKSLDTFNLICSPCRSIWDGHYDVLSLREVADVPELLHYDNHVCSLSDSVCCVELL